MGDSTLAEVFNFIGYPQLVKTFGTENWELGMSRYALIFPIELKLLHKSSRYNKRQCFYIYECIVDFNDSGALWVESYQRFRKNTLS
jgi:hypothetical protein